MIPPEQQDGSWDANQRTSGQPSSESPAFSDRLAHSPHPQPEPSSTLTQSLLALLDQANLPGPLLHQVNQQLAHLEDQLYRQAQMIEQLRQESLTDSLTGLPNRRAYDEKIQAEWTRAMRTRQPLALISIDVDYFKRYNDCYGHAQGDVCLQEVAQILKQLVQRGGDLVCRVGGEEFMVVLPGATTHTAKALAEKIRLGLAMKALRHEQNETSQIVTLSMGVAHTIPDPNQSPELLYRAVDQALYQAKQQGRNQISLAAPEVCDPANLYDRLADSLPPPKGVVNIRSAQTAIDRSRSAAAKARWHRLMRYLICLPQKSFNPRLDC